MRDWVLQVEKEVLQLEALALDEKYGSLLRHAYIDTVDELLCFPPPSLAEFLKISREKARELIKRAEAVEMEGGLFDTANGVGSATTQVMGTEVAKGQVIQIAGAGGALLKRLEPDLTITNGGACNAGVVKTAKNLAELRLRIYFLLRDVKVYEVERVVVQGFQDLLAELQYDKVGKGSLERRLLKVLEGVAGAHDLLIMLLSRGSKAVRENIEKRFRVAENGELLPVS